MRLWAAVSIFLVPRFRSLLKLSGTRAQVPRKSLFWRGCVMILATTIEVGCVGVDLVEDEAGPGELPGTRLPVRQPPDRPPVPGGVSISILIIIDTTILTRMACGTWAVCRTAAGRTQRSRCTPAPTCRGSGVIALFGIDLENTLLFAWPLCVLFGLCLICVFVFVWSCLVWLSIHLICSPDLPPAVVWPWETWGARQPGCRSNTEKS